MRFFTNLLFKVTVSSMVLTAPAMVDTHADGVLPDKGAELPYASATVIKTYINHLKIWPVRAYMNRQAIVKTFSAESIKTDLSPVASGKNEAAARAIETTPTTSMSGMSMPAIATSTGSAAAIATAASALIDANRSASAFFSAKAAALKRVIRQSAILYAAIGLDKDGLSQEAFEYAWRGYHNLLRKGSIRKKAVLSIADFSQSSSEKRMYVIDIRHKRLLYRTYVAHGQNSGSEYADSFSNEPESFKSSLGFYVTKTTYVGRNGLSLRLNGVDNGFNDNAMERNIVLHGCSYVGEQYLESYGSTGTSLGCPALPAAVSGQIIKTVKNGSCLFIYHPSPDYLAHSTVINE